MHSFWYNAPTLLPDGDMDEMERSSISQPCRRYRIKINPQIYNNQNDYSINDQKSPKIKQENKQNQIIPNCTAQ
jgi:hypothetical protein